MNTKFIFLIFFLSISFKCFSQQHFPEVKFKSLLINNVPAEPGKKDSPLKQEIDKQNEIVLNYGQNNFGFEVGSSDTGKVYYSYLLEGFSNSWISGTQSSFSFINIPAGEYIFKIKASYKEDQWRENHRQIKITIHPPFWQTWWWRLIVISLLIFTFYRILRFREEKLKKKAAEKERIQQDQLQKKETERKLYEAELRAIRSQLNPHFLFNSLSAIQNLVNKQDTEAANIYLSKFSGLMRMILNNSDKIAVSVDEELKAIQLYLELEKLRLDFNYSIIIDEDLDIHATEIPSMLIQPLVENAIFHGLSHQTGEKNLRIKIQKKEQSILCTIEDNGIGWRKSEQYRNDSGRNGKALKLTKERLEAICNEMHVPLNFELINKSDLNKGSGTIIIFDLPIMN